MRLGQKIIWTVLGFLLALGGMGYELRGAAPSGPTTATRGGPAATSAAAIIRVAAGRDVAFKDSAGNVWKAESGFEGGATIERPDITVAGTKDVGLFRAEHYSMDAFTAAVPNGKYVVKLYFAETYEGIAGPGNRVFSFDVQGHAFKDFDIWKKAGGPMKAYVETIEEVVVKEGKLKITFTPQVENPSVCGIEIIPVEERPAATVARGGATGATATVIRIAAGREKPFTDAAGQVWEADRGFDGGTTINRPGLSVQDTKDSELYCSERYSMKGYVVAVPNGKYVVRLHFAETYDGVAQPGERVFTYSVQGHEVKDFDVWKKTGGPYRACVETVKDVEVTDGKLKISFVPQVGNPQVNAIEVLPAEGP